MAMTVGIVGFGRIGRNVFRLLYKRDDLRVVAVSDLGDAASVEYLLKFDTLFGRFPDEISAREGHLYVVGRQIALLADQERGATPPWKELGVDTVVEATAKTETRADLEKHLRAGAKRVLLCEPPVDPLDLTVVNGINDSLLKREHAIVSCASSTVHCVAPLAKILLGAFGIRKLLFTTIHSYTNQHRLADVPAEDMRRGRAAAENIIPQESRSAGMLQELIPELRGKVVGAAMNVPVPNGSAVDLVCWHEKNVTVTAINEVVRTAIASQRSGIMDYETEPIVSSDVAHSSFSSTFDSRATMTLGENVSKTLSWYDAGWGYAHRVVELLERFAALDREAAR
jgi:glyceraldehyde 3-phosphate dehydrogenase